MLHANELPEPSESALVVSNELRDYIRRALAKHGHIGFDDYMQWRFIRLGLVIIKLVRSNSGLKVTSSPLPNYRRCLGVASHGNAVKFWKIPVAEFLSLAQAVDYLLRGF